MVYLAGGFMEEEEVTSKALSSIAKSSVLIISGVALSTLLSFFSKIIIARFYNVSEYGVYGITFTIVNIAVTLSLLGLHSYVPREIASSKTLDKGRLGSIVSTSLLITLISSLAVFSIIFLSSDKLALVFGSDPRVGYALRIVLIALPPIVIRKIIVAFSFPATVHPKSLSLLSI
jgi:O-antigen/teichoic acid export membrane protein